MQQGDDMAPRERAYRCGRLVMDSKQDLVDEIDKLRRALRYGCGASINSLPPGEMEWSPNSGIGVMLAALGCNATQYGDDVRAALSE